MDVNWELNDIDFCLSQFEGLEIQVIESLRVEADEDLGWVDFGHFLLMSSSLLTPLWWADAVFS